MLIFVFSDPQTQAVVVFVEYRGGKEIALDVIGVVGVIDKVEDGVVLV